MQLVQVGGDQQDASAGVAGLPQLVPDRGLGTDVDAAGGVRGDQHARVRLDNSRPTMSFCWLPPDSAKAGTVSLGVRTPKVVDDVAGCRRRAAGGVDERPRPELRASVSPAEQRVLPQRGGRASVLHDAGRTGCSRCPRRGSRSADSSVMSRPSSWIAPEASGRMPMIASHSSNWPLPSTPATPRTSPACTVQRRPSTSGFAPTPATVNRVQLEPDARSVTWWLAARGLGSSEADHHLRELAPVGVAGLHSADRGAGAG